MLRNTRKTFKFLTFLCCICCFFNCQDSTNSEESGMVKIDLEKLLGKWQSLNNPKNVIELTNSRMYSYYDGLKLADESLMIYHNCVARCMPEGVTEMPCLVTDGKKAENCFKVIELTDKKLTYALVGSEDKLLQFQKL